MSKNVKIKVKHLSLKANKAIIIDGTSVWHSGLRGVLSSQEVIGAAHGSRPPESTVVSFSVAVFQELDNSCLTISFPVQLSVPVCGCLKRRKQLLGVMKPSHFTLICNMKSLSHSERHGE